MELKQNKIFLIVVSLCYVLAISLSFARIYVFHAYPIFYTEEDIPSLFSEIIDVLYPSKP